jgi:hypothetical protein
MKFVRRLTPVFSLFLFLIFTQTARAQISVYGAAALTNFGFSHNGNTSFKSDTGGFVGGMFYNFPIQSRLTAGIDARGSYGFGPMGGTSVLGALRIGFVPKRVVLRPYVQIGGGVVSSTADVDQTTGPLQTRRYTTGAVEFAAGLDVRLNESFDVRAFELGGAAGGSGSGTSVGTAFLDAGIVYHFHKRP